MRSSRWKSRHQNGKNSCCCWYCCMCIDNDWEQNVNSRTEAKKMCTLAHSRTHTHTQRRICSNGDRWLPLLCYAINVELYWMRCQMHDHCYWLGNIAISHTLFLSLTLTHSLADLSRYFHSFTFFPIILFCHHSRRWRRQRHGMHVCFYLFHCLARSITMTPCLSVRLV